MVPADVAAATIRRAAREYSLDGEMIDYLFDRVDALKRRVAELEQENAYLRDELLPKARFQKV